MHRTFKAEKFKAPEKAKVMEIWTWKCKQDTEIHKKIMLQRYITPNQVIVGYQKLESQKVHDNMYDKFGVWMDEVSVGIEEHKLPEDKLFKGLNEMTKKQNQSEEMKFVQQCTPEDKKAFLAKAREFGKPQFKSDQTMTFDYFLNTKLHSLENSVQYMQERFIEMTKERRVLLKQLEANKDDKHLKEEYNLMLIKRVAMQTISERSFDASMYQDLKVDEKIYLKSLQMYMMDPEKRKLIEESTEALREKYRKAVPKEMDKDKVYECVKLLEQFKFEAQVKMYTIVRMQ